MRSSKVIFKEQTETGIIPYEPKKVHMDEQVRKANFSILQNPESEKSFRVNDLISSQIGFSEEEAKKKEKAIENTVMARLKSIEEKAYKEAYDLGRTEGRQDAYNDFKLIIEDQLQKFELVMKTLSIVKKTVLDQNEAQIVDLIYYMAKKIALDHIESNPNRIVPVLRDIVENLSDEEKITVRLSKTDFDYIESLKKEMKREFDFLKKLSIEESSDIKLGGCIFETKDGLKDATLEERLNKLWKLLDENKPKTETK